MELVIDANVIFSALISTGGKTCDLLFSDEISLFAPEFLKEEFEKHKQEILLKSKLAEVDFELALSLIFSRIKIIPGSEFGSFIQQAKEVCPDPNDAEYFALALKQGCPIWSNDKELKNQKNIKIYSTQELLEPLDNS